MKTVEQRIKEFKKIMEVDKTKTTVLSERFFKYLKESGFFSSPASIKHHNNHQGGLYDHSVDVTNQLIFYTKKLDLKWEQPESPWVVGLFHDVCKMGCYIETGFNPPYRWNNSLDKDDHGTKSVRILKKYIELTEEEELCIRYHMGAYAIEDWDDYDKAIKKYPNVLYTHMADMYASRFPVDRT